MWRRSRRSLATITAVVAAIALTACADRRGSHALTSRLVGPRGPYGSVVWVTDDEVLLTRSAAESSGAPMAHLVEVSLEKGEFQPLAVPRGAEPCKLRTLRSLTEISPGHIGYLDVCLNDGSAQVRSFSTLMELEVSTGDARSIASFAGRTPTRVTWAPALRRGYVESDSSICAAFESFDSSGVRLEPLLLTDNGVTWDIATGRSGAADGCRGAGRAKSPQITSEGEVAFLASPSSLPKAGQSRLDEPWYVYSSAAEKFAPRRISPAIAHAGSLRWSRDKVAAVSGEVDGTKGLWLLTQKDGTQRFRLVLSGDVGSFAWSHDGSRLAVLVRHDDESQLVVVDVSPQQT